MLTYLVNIQIPNSGENTQMQIDNALEGLTIKGIALSPNTVTKVGVNAISTPRKGAAHLVLSKGNETIIDLPLSMLDMSSKQSLYFPIHIPARTLSTQRSQITFGENITAQNLESVELVFFVE